MDKTTKDILDNVYQMKTETLLALAGVMLTEANSRLLNKKVKIMEE